MAGTSTSGPDAAGGSSSSAELLTSLMRTADGGLLGDPKERDLSSLQVRTLFPVECAPHAPAVHEPAEAPAPVLVRPEIRALTIGPFC